MSDARERILADLIAGNKKREEDLGRDGAQVAPIGILELRLAALIDIMQDDPDFDLDYKIAYQRRLSEAFEQIAKQVREMKLTQGIGGSGLLVPGPAPRIHPNNGAGN